MSGFLWIEGGFWSQRPFPFQNLGETIREGSLGNAKGRTNFPIMG